LEIVYREISRQIGSTANYAGDGPPKRFNSLNINGLKICKVGSRFHVADVNQHVLRSKFTNHIIHIGDEIIKLNEMYSEHLGNVTKYIESTQIQSMQLRNKISGNCYNVVTHQETSANVGISTEKMCLRNNCKCRLHHINKLT